jgi:hypothetical protein
VLVVSGGAKKAALEAARDAKRTLYTRNLVGDLRACSDDLALISSLCDTGRFDIATFLSYRLLQKLSFFSERWKEQLDVESIKAIQEVISTCGKLGISLRKSQAALDASEVMTLKDHIESLAALVAREIGKQEARVDIAGSALTTKPTASGAS